MSYVLAAYAVTGVSLVAYAAYLARERAHGRKSASRGRQTNNG